MNEEIISISKELIRDIQYIVFKIETLYYADIQKKYEDNPDDSNEKRLQKQETYFDLMFEKYITTKEILEKGMMMKELMKNVQNKFDIFINHWKANKTSFGHKLNLILDQIEETEKNVKGKIFTDHNNIMINENLLDERKDWNITKEERKEHEREENIRMKIHSEEIEKRLKVTNEILSENELLMIEKETKRCFSTVLFNSDRDNWSSSKNNFFSKIQNQSNLFFLVETTEQKKFGCFISTKIGYKGQFLPDKNAFIFKFENDKLIKFPIKDFSNAIKISEKSNDDYLFVIGHAISLFEEHGDIVIKKSERKDKCSCYQSSFNYNGKQNALIDKYDYFEVKKFVVVNTIQLDLMSNNIDKKVENQIQLDIQKEKETQQNQQLRFDSLKTENYLKEIDLLTFEQWTSMEIESILYESKTQNWDLTHLLNNFIIGKKRLLFLFENEKREKFGYFLNTKVTNKFNQKIETDERSFHFNLKSNGRYLIQ